MDQMERTTWTDERLDDAFTQLRAEMRQGFSDMRAEMRQGFDDMRAEMRDMRGEDRSIRGEIAQVKLFMLGSYVTILAAIIATNV
jgi:hypothetical protein